MSQLSRPSAPWVPYRRHAATFLLSGAPLAIVSAVGAAAGNVALAVAPLAIAVTPVVIALVLRIVCYSWDRKLRALAAEEPLFLDWTYDGETWRRFVDSQGKGFRYLGLLVIAIAVFVGLVVSVLFAADGGEIAGSTALALAVPIGAAAALGAWIAFLVRWNFHATRRERLRRGGRLLLGTNGFYVTGEYRPLAGLGQRLTKVETRVVDGETRLRLTWFVTSGRYSSDQVVDVPVPSDRESEARAAVRTLTGGRG